jgi:hypothetical protein
LTGVIGADGLGKTKVRTSPGASARLERREIGSAPSHEDEHTSERDAHANITVGKATERRELV